MTESEFLSSSSCPHCSASSQQSRELDVVVIQVDPLEAGQSCVAEESLQVVSHPLAYDFRTGVAGRDPAVLSEYAVAEAAL